ncbi:MAG: hypothetical protein ACI4TM_03980 [Candidatus Cryptobacteroides sp.]
MDFLDLIVALLFVLIPFAGKLIEKRLKKSAGSSKKVTAEEWKEILSETIREMKEEKAGEHVEESEEAAEPVSCDSVYEDIEPEAREEPVAAAQAIPVVNTVLKPAAATIVQQVDDAFTKDETDKKKIDPKKLVIYSEIMTPKFRD